MSIDSTQLVFSGKSAGKVREHLEQGVRNGLWGPGSRLPGTDDLARELKVSSGTVKNVYRQLARDGKIRTHVGVGSFWTGEGEQESKTWRIGLNLRFLPENKNYSSWTDRIFNGVLRYKFESNENIILEPCGEFGEDLETSERNVSDLDPQDRSKLNLLDGLLAFSSKELPERLLDVQGREIPYVSIYPQGEQRKANFVAPDYFECSRQLGETWARTGRKRIAIVGFPRLAESVSMRLRFCGMLAGLEAGGDLTQIELRLIKSHPPCLHDEGETAVSEFIEKTQWIPDAIYCVGDGLATGAISVMKKLGRRIPEDVSIVGGNGIEATFVARALTSMSHPLERIGFSMLEMLMRRIRSGAPEASGFEPVPFLIGSTTRPEENEYFERFNTTVGDRQEG